MLPLIAKKRQMKRSEQKEQLLNLLRHILNGGRRNKSLKGEMLRTIVDEVGSDVDDYVDQKLQSTCLYEHFKTSLITLQKSPPSLIHCA